jgi:hypothetical protein
LAVREAESQRGNIWLVELEDGRAIICEWLEANLMCRISDVPWPEFWSYGMQTFMYRPLPDERERDWPTMAKYLAEKVAGLDGLTPVSKPQPRRARSRRGFSAN